MASAINGIDGVGAKKPKLTKNQMRRAKKKEKKVEGRDTRETSMVTDSEAESKPEPEIEVRACSAATLLLRMLI